MEISKKTVEITYAGMTAYCILRLPLLDDAHHYRMQADRPLVRMPDELECVCWCHTFGHTVPTPSILSLIKNITITHQNKITETINRCYMFSLVLSSGECYSHCSVHCLPPQVLLMDTLND